jgi:hypothetical protein
VLKYFAKSTKFGANVIDILWLVIDSTLKNINNCFNTNIYSYLKISGGQSSKPYLNVVHFFNIRVNKKAVFLHWCLILAVPFRVICESAISYLVSIFKTEKFISVLGMFHLVVT